MNSNGKTDETATLFKLINEFDQANKLHHDHMNKLNSIDLTLDNRERKQLVEETKDYSSGILGKLEQALDLYRYVNRRIEISIGGIDSSIGGSLDEIEKKK